MVVQVIILEPKAVFGGALRELGEADISTGEEIVVGLGFGGLLPREGAVRLAVRDG
jgi:hypothetical protein